MVKLKMISGQGTTFTVITLNPESNSTRREKNHSQFHYDTLTWPEQQVRLWMWTSHWIWLEYWRKPRPIKIYGLGSHDSPYWTKNFLMGMHPGLIICCQRHGKTCQKQRHEKKNKSGLSENRSLTTLEDCVVFSSLIQKMKNSRRLWKMRGECCYEEWEPCHASSWRVFIHWTSLVCVSFGCFFVVRLSALVTCTGRAPPENAF